MAWAFDKYQIWARNVVADHQDYFKKINRRLAVIDCICIMYLSFYPFFLDPKIQGVPDLLEEEYYTTNPPISIALQLIGLFFEKATYL